MSAVETLHCDGPDCGNHVPITQVPSGEERGWVRIDLRLFLGEPRDRMVADLCSDACAEAWLVRVGIPAVRGQDPAAMHELYDMLALDPS